MKSKCQHKRENRRVCPADCDVPPAGGASVQLWGIFDILGWLDGLI